MDADKVLGIKDGILILARLALSVHGGLQRTGVASMERTCPGTHLSCRVDYLRREVFPFVGDDFGEGVFDGGVVALDKVPFNILDRERRFTCDSIYVS